jgi:DNA-directed RNA polymerase specialized sigma24 family protein
VSASMNESARRKGSVIPAPTLTDFVRHAERFGVECVYETAEETGLSDLGYLTRHLRRIDRSWRLSPNQRERLIAELLGAGLPQREIADLAGVSTDTVGRASAELRDSAARNRMVEPKKSRKSHQDNPPSVLVESAGSRGSGRRGRP